ncbi:hypothetical protein [Leptospira barantonii]|uniref:Lipoprotein n=1 Tax=Leptospira barantonii TaxID=2023184 RepID=A0ABX4NHZ8_9LEPT|nr:hypothetical protein [Leptospira barantonii]PJZ55611.1 hypothetical protein CH367_19245 [Leptospira barantonii]
MPLKFFLRSSLRLFLFFSLLSFFSCIWLTADTQQVPLKKRIFQTEEDVIYKPILIRISDGAPLIVGDPLGSLECVHENGKREIPAFDIYDRNETYNGKPSDKLRTLIKNAIPSALFKSDYCSTVETKENVYLDDNKWKFQLEKYAEIQKEKPHLCHKIRKVNSINIIRSRFSETCIPIPKSELTIDISRQEAVLLAEGKIRFNIRYTTRSLGYGLGWMFNILSLGFMSLDSHVYAGSILKTESEVGTENETYVMRSMGRMRKSVWNYFLWPIWIFKPTERIRFGTPFSDPDDTIGLDDFTQESTRQTLIVEFLEKRLQNRK